MYGTVLMRERLTERNDRLARLTRVGASSLLLLGIIYAGWTVIPHRGSIDTAAASRQSEQSTRGSPRIVPVFIMRSDQSVVRHGTAILGGDGQVSVSLFASTASEEPDATEALLFQPTVTVLWAAAPDKSRDELKQHFESLQAEAAHSFETLITSDVFTNLYRPVLAAILTDAVRQAWEDNKTQSALSDLLGSSDSAFREKMRDGLEDIVLSRIKDGVWDMLQANWLNALGVPLGYDLDYTPVTRAIGATLQDPRLQQTLMEFGSERLSTVQARKLAERIVIGVVESLINDRRVPEVVSAMFWDPRLREMARPFTDAAAGLGAALPRDLGGLGTKSSSLNPLAAHIFKSLLLGQHTPLILFVTPEERTRLEHLVPDATRLLHPAVTAEQAT